MFVDSDHCFYKITVVLGILWRYVSTNGMCSSWPSLFNSWYYDEQLVSIKVQSMSRRCSLGYCSRLSWEPRRMFISVSMELWCFSQATIRAVNHGLWALDAVSIFVKTEQSGRRHIMQIISFVRCVSVCQILRWSPLAPISSWEVFMWHPHTDEEG